MASAHGVLGLVDWLRDLIDTMRPFERSGIKFGVRQVPNNFADPGHTHFGGAFRVKKINFHQDTSEKYVVKIKLF